MSCSMDELPVELHAKIVSLVVPIGLNGKRDGKADLCNLRLVSKYFEDLVSPILFDHLNLGFRDATLCPSSDCYRCQDIILAMASGATHVFKYTKTLDFSASPLFSTSCSKSLDLNVKSGVVENIFQAISSLENLRVVSWAFDSALEPESLAIDFIRALATIPFLSAFERLDLPGGLKHSICLKPISNLTTLRVVWDGRTDHFVNEISSLLGRCPEMTNLRVDGPFFYGDGTVFGEIFATANRLGLSLPLRRLELNGVAVASSDIATNLRHLKHIEHLGIMRNPVPGADTVLGEICAILKDRDIFLNGVCTDFPDDPLLLDYLVSYSGLRELHFDPRPQSPNCPAALVERFYTEVLPPHHHSLEHLKFTHWPFPALAQDGQPSLNPLAEVAKCRSLRVLDVRCPCDELYKDPGNFEEWLEVCAQLQDLVQFNLYSYLEPSIFRALEQFRERNGKQFLVWGC